VEQEWASLIIPVLALLFYVSWRMFPRLIGWLQAICIFFALSIRSDGFFKSFRSGSAPTTAV
jgi:hypothetical protein